MGTVINSAPIRKLHRRRSIWRQVFATLRVVDGFSVTAVAAHAAEARVPAPIVLDGGVMVRVTEPQRAVSMSNGSSLGLQLLANYTQSGAAVGYDAIFDDFGASLFHSLTVTSRQLPAVGSSTRIPRCAVLDVVDVPSGKQAATPERWGQ